MLRLFNSNGDLKIPLKAFRTHGNEFLIYVTDFGVEGWKEMINSRVCMCYSSPRDSLVKDLQLQIENAGHTNHILINAIL
jgi:hypothetical protein